MVKAMVRQAVALQPMEVHGGADTQPAAHGGPHATAGGCAVKEAVALWEARTVAGSWQDPCYWQSVPHGKDPRWSSL